MRQITPGDPAMGQIRSRDGKLLLASVDGRLWSMKPDGTERMALKAPRDIGWFALCGKSIALTASAGGSSSLFLLDQENSRLSKLVDGDLWAPECSRDGETVFYVNFDQPQRIWRIDAKGGNPIEVTRILGDSIEGTLSVSPDGQFLVYGYTSYTDTQPRHLIAVISLPDGKVFRSFVAPGDTWSPGPYWTADGKAFQYLATQNGVSNIWEQRLDGSPSKPITRFSSGELFDFAWSADRTELFVTRGTTTSDAVLFTGLR